MLAKVFDTYKRQSTFDDLLGKGIDKGHIVVAACKDDMIKNLSEDGKRFFANMGSKEIWNLQFRQGFAFIGITGRTDSVEKRAAQTGQATATAVFKVHTIETTRKEAERPKMQVL